MFLPASEGVQQTSLRSLALLTVTCSLLTFHQDRLTMNKVLKTGTHSSLRPFWSPFILHLLRRLIRYIKGENVSRAHSLAQSCYVEISSLLFPHHYKSFTTRPPGKGKVSREMSMKHMQGRASRCDMSASTTLNDEVRMLGGWGLTDGLTNWLTDRRTEGLTGSWRRESCYHSRRETKIITFPIVNCVCVFRHFWGRIRLHENDCPSGFGDKMCRHGGVSENKTLLCHSHSPMYTCMHVWIL